MSRKIEICTYIYNYIHRKTETEIVVEIDIDTDTRTNVMISALSATSVRRTVRHNTLASCDVYRPRDGVTYLFVGVKGASPHRRTHGQNFAKLAKQKVRSRHVRASWCMVL